MAVIATGRLQRGAQKALGVKGETVFPDLDSALQPSFEILNADGPDFRSLFGWYSYARSISVLGDATHPGIIAVVNPVGSGILMRVTKWLLLSDVGDAEVNFNWNTSVGVAVASSSGRTLDSRNQKTSLGGLTSFSTVALGGTSISTIMTEGLAVAALFNRFVVVDQNSPLIVNPGELYMVGGGQNNKTVKGSVWWQERALDPSEVGA